MRKHLSDDGVLRDCRAKDGNCPKQHFETIAEYEATVEAEYEQRKFQGVSKGKAGVVNAGVLKLLYSDLCQQGSLNLADTIRLGEVFNSGVAGRLSFDPNTVPSGKLSEKQYGEIRDAVRGLYRELGSSGGVLKNEVSGTAKMVKSFNDAISVLPDSVKNSYSDMPVVLKSVPKTAGFNGKFSTGVVEVVSCESSFDVPDFYADDWGSLQPGEFHTLSMSVSDVDFMDEEYSGRLYRKSEDGTAEVLWVGDKAPKAKSKKLGEDRVVISSNGYKSDVGLRTISRVSSSVMQNSIIVQAKSDVPDSVFIHEFAHGVEHFNDGIDSDSYRMYRKFADVGESYYDESYGVKSITGLPNAYMGASGGVEFFTKATEGFFCPDSPENGFFYGSDRVASSDEIKNWVTGVWVSLALKDSK